MFQLENVKHLYHVDFKLKDILTDEVTLLKEYWITSKYCLAQLCLGLYKLCEHLFFCK